MEKLRFFKGNFANLPTEKIPDAFYYVVDKKQFIINDMVLSEGLDSQKYNELLEKINKNAADVVDLNENKVSKTELKTINGESLIVTGETTDLKVSGGIDIVNGDEELSMLIKEEGNIASKINPMEESIMKYDLNNIPILTQEDVYLKMEEEHNLNPNISQNDVMFNVLTNNSCEINHFNFLKNAVIYDTSSIPSDVIEKYYEFFLISETKDYVYYFEFVYGASETNPEYNNMFGISVSYGTIEDSRNLTYSDLLTYDEAGNPIYDDITITKLNEDLFNRNMYAIVIKDGIITEKDKNNFINFFDISYKHISEKTVSLNTRVSDNWTEIFKIYDNGKISYNGINDVKKGLTIDELNSTDSKIGDLGTVYNKNVFDGKNVGIDELRFHYDTDIKFNDNRKLIKYIIDNGIDILAFDVLANTLPNTIENVDSYDEIRISLEIVKDQENSQYIDGIDIYVMKYNNSEYAIKRAVFRGNNLFDYLVSSDGVTYNLSLSQDNIDYAKGAIINSVKSKVISMSDHKIDADFLTINNLFKQTFIINIPSRIEECVFLKTKINDNNWKNIVKANKDSTLIDGNVEINFPKGSTKVESLQDLLEHSGVGKTTDEGGEIFNLYDKETVDETIYGPVYSPANKAGSYSHAEGYNTKAIGEYSHAEGSATKSNGNNSHAEGYETTASGNYGSHAEGYSTESRGKSSHAEGSATKSNGEASHAEGRGTRANGNSSHAEGCDTRAIGNYSHSEGNNTTANGDYSHAEGYNTITNNPYEHAIGCTNVSHTGETSNLQTIGSIGIGKYVSYYNNEKKNAIEVMQNGDMYILNVNDYDGINIKGNTLQDYLLKHGGIGVANLEHGEIFNDYTNNKANASFSHAEGMNTTTNSMASHAEGSGSITGKIGVKKFHIIGREDKSIEGYLTCNLKKDSGNIKEVKFSRYSGARIDYNWYVLKGPNGTEYSNYIYSSDILGPFNFPEDVFTNPELYHIDFMNSYGSEFQPYTHVEQTFDLIETIIDYDVIKFAHAEGLRTLASGDYSHTEGSDTTASGESSHAEGNSTRANGNSSHAEGNNTIADASYSHSEGHLTKAKGIISHAEGSGTTASGDCSHAEGSDTNSSGKFSHAEGSGTTTYGEASHAEGSGTTTSGDCSHAEGRDTKAYGKFSHAEGSGTTAYGITSHSEGSGTTAGKVSSIIEYLILQNVSDSNDIRNVSYDNGKKGWGVYWFDGIYNTLELYKINPDGTSSNETYDCVNYPSDLFDEGKHKMSQKIGGDFITGYEYRTFKIIGVKYLILGDYSHAEGMYTETSNESEHAEGMCNLSHSGETIDKKTLSSIGFGSYNKSNKVATRKNAFEVMKNGDVYISGVNEYDGINVTGNTLQALLNNYKTEIDAMKQKITALETEIQNLKKL